MTETARSMARFAPLRRFVVSKVCNSVPIGAVHQRFDIRSNLLFDDPPCWDAPERRPGIWGPPVNWYSRRPDSNSLSGKSPRGIPIAAPGLDFKTLRSNSLKTSLSANVLLFSLSLRRLQASHLLLSFPSDVPQPYRQASHRGHQCDLFPLRISRHQTLIRLALGLMVPHPAPCRLA